jgi:hypothetical protein
MPIRPIPSPPADPPDDEGEFDLSQLSDPNDDEEEQEDDDDPEAPAVARAPDPAETVPRRRGRKPRGAQDPKPVGVGATIKEPRTYWKDRNLEVLWPEVLEYLRVHGRSPYEVDLRVKRTEPIEQLIGEPFSGGTVMGADGRAAATMVVDKVTNDYHMFAGAMGPATYKVEIIWRVNSKVLTWGTLRLASPDAIMGFRRAQSSGMGGSGSPASVATHYYPPPPPQYQPPQYPPQYQPPYAGYGAPPPQPPPSSGSSDDVRELHYLRGTMDEVLRALREGRPPNIAPPPGPAAMPSVDDIARRVVEMLRPGFGAPPAAVPVPTPPTPAVSVFESSVQSIMQNMIQGTLKKVAGNINQAMGADPQSNEAVAEIMSDDPKEDLPFSVIPVGSKWPDGRDVYFPKKKTDGSIDYMGVLAANPFLMEKLADSASGLIGSVGDLVKNLGRAAIPGAAEVVHNIPRAAVQAGMGQPQAPPYQPPSQPPPPAPTVTPHANGVAPAPVPSGGGWPT